MFAHLLAQRAANDNPIRVGIIGTGKFGAGLVAQLEGMQGVCACVLADIDVERARRAYTTSKVPEEAIEIAASAADIDRIVAAGKRALTPDGLQIASAESIDVVVEATGLPVPETWMCADAAPLLPLLDDGPVIVKPSDGERGEAGTCFS